MELDHFIIFTRSLALAAAISVLVTVVWQNAEVCQERARAEKPPPTFDIATDNVDWATVRGHG